MKSGKPCDLERLDARIPQWDLSALTKRDCPFCRSEHEPLLVRPDSLPLAFCSGCGCWYVAQLPSVSDIKRLYEGYYCSHRPVDLSVTRAARVLEQVRRASETDWQLKILSRLLGGLGGKRILDVGCGWGRFLVMARSAGADVVGCDLSPGACEFANHGLGITVYQSDLHSCSSAIGDVDAVVMRDFVEHPIEPLIDLQAARAILKPGGLLLWHTPNGEEAGTNVETAKQWVGFRVDLEHLQYVSPRTVNWLSRRLDLSIERLDAFGFPGLHGIEALPKARSRSVDWARDVAGRIPYVRTMARVLQSVTAEIRGECRDPRLGSYHLFAILRQA